MRQFQFEPASSGYQIAMKEVPRPVAGIFFEKWINATTSGVYVGSREDFEAMNAFISEHGIRTLIDRVFEFEEAPAAHEHMESGDLMGKIVIRL